MTYWLFYIIPALAFIIFFIIYRKQAAENANVAKMRTKKANKVATRRLKAAGKYLKEHQKPELSKRIEWNFTKFLLDQNGHVVERFEPLVTPYEIEDEIIKLLIKNIEST